MSKTGKPPVADYLGHILQAIQRIDRYVSGFGAEQLTRRRRSTDLRLGVGLLPPISCRTR